MKTTEHTPAERLAIFLHLKKFSFDEFARIIDSEKLISHASKYVGRGNKSTLKKYLNSFHKAGLNKDWYLTGKGEMLIEDEERMEKQRQLVLSSDVVPVYDEIIDLIDKLPPDKLKEYLIAKREFIEKTNTIIKNNKES